MQKRFQLGYIALSEKAYSLAKKRFSERKTGSIFKDAQMISEEELLER